MGIEEHINLTQINEISDGDMAFEEEILNLYFKDTEEKVRSMEALQLKKNWVELKRDAHSLKGSSVNIGVTCTFDLCKELEAACLEQSAENTSLIIQKLKKASTEVKAFFEHYLNGMKP